MTPNKLYITNEDGEMVEVCGDIKIESVESVEGVAFNTINDNHLIHSFDPERQCTFTVDSAADISAIPVIDKYDEKIDALEKRIAQLEDSNNDEFNMRRVL